MEKLDKKIDKLVRYIGMNTRKYSHTLIGRVNKIQKYNETLENKLRMILSIMESVESEPTLVSLLDKCGFTDGEIQSFGYKTEFIVKFYIKGTKITTEIEGDSRVQKRDCDEMRVCKLKLRDYNKYMKYLREYIEFKRLNLGVWTQFQLDEFNYLTHKLQSLEMGY